MAIIILDRLLGMLFAYMGEHAKGGYIGHHYYAANNVDDDILVFGSSRAVHHYNPRIISDSLELSCYNCGQDGNGIVFFYGLWQMIKPRHIPKMIIYDVTPYYDIYEGDSNQRYLGWLRTDYDRPGVKDIFLAVDSKEQYKMMSMLYRYNSKFLQVITDYIHPIFGFDGNGFLPLEGEVDRMKVRDEENEIKIVEPPVDALKIGYINKLIDEVQSEGVSLVFVVSPSWYEPDLEEYIPIMEICNQRNIKFIDFSNNEKYVHQYEWFKDGAHLNARGADEFTKDLISLIQ